jgi:hypothetical protein
LDHLVEDFALQTSKGDFLNSEDLIKSIDPLFLRSDSQNPQLIVVRQLHRLKVSIDVKEDESTSMQIQVIV